MDLTSTTNLNSITYNNTKTIVGAQNPDVSYNYELPVINGLFKYVSPYNTYNLTTNLAGGTIPIRYATFGWKMTDVASSSRARLYFCFSTPNSEVFTRAPGANIITNLTSTSVAIDFNIFVQNDSYSESAGYANDFRTTGWVNGSTINDNFQTGNTTGPGLFSSSGFYNLSGSTLTLSNSTAGGNTLSYATPGISIKDPVASGYVLLRVGIPINSTFSFSNIRAILK
jgi:hypothetical protein